MASNISTTTIDENYPVAGIDNDSQGFRDNFTSIKTNLTTAGTEITALQANRARIDADNDHSGNEIQNAELLQVTPKFNDAFGQLSADHEVDYRDAHVHVINWTVSGPGNSFTVTFTGWPTERYASLRLIMSVNNPGNDTQITLSAGAGEAKLNDASNAATWNGTRILTHGGAIAEKIIVDVFTYDTGNTLYFEYVDRFTTVA